MTLNDAWAEALKKIPVEDRPKGDPKMIGLIWSIIAVALNEKEKSLDDISFIDNNQQIISIPLQKSATKTAKETKPVKSKVDKTNGKEKKEKPKEPDTTEKE